MLFRYEGLFCPGWMPRSTEGRAYLARRASLPYRLPSRRGPATGTRTCWKTRLENSGANGFRTRTIVSGGARIDHLLLGAEVTSVAYLFRLQMARVQLREYWRDHRERIGILRLLLAETDYNAQVLISLERVWLGLFSVESLRLVPSLKIDVWLAVRGADLAGAAGRADGPLDTAHGLNPPE